MAKVSLNDLDKTFTASDYVLLTGLGFDGRALEILKRFPKERCSQIVGISNAGWNDFNATGVALFKQLVGEKGIVLGENAENVIAIADAVSSYIKPLLLKQADKFLIDVTAVSHELLAIILGILESLDALNQVTLLYLGANKYSFNTESKDIWLSRGVRDIRSVLGFPGMMYPSKKLHLIVLAGFEVERATEVIKRYEPTFLSIGHGKKDESVSDDHHQENRRFFDKLKDFVSEQNSYSETTLQFDFSCIDPCKTKFDIIKHIDEIPNSGDRNFVICPLNTKLSTVGVILAALERPKFQICYAEPEEYNRDGYAQAGSEVTIVDLKVCT